MKELDFEELDKAVNSLMGDVSQNDASSTGGSSITAAAPTPTPDSAALPVQGSEVAPVIPEATGEAASPALPSPASRRGGRFMDVVHPSSDMKTTQMASSSREGVAITPPAADTLTAPSLEQNTPVEEVATSTEAIVETPASNDLPDPIDVSAKNQVDEPEKPIPSTYTPEPLSSPFLTDAKVEKRPLGGGQALDQAIANELSKADTEQPTEDAATIVAEPVQSLEEMKPAVPNPREIASQLPAEAEDKAPLPAELGSDILAIEAGGVTAENKTASVTAEPTETPSTSAVGTGSIQQQYTEQPSTGDDSHTAIYDTDAAVQPLNHPPKKKTGWLVTIWIVLIIILGVGVGAGIWYFGLI